MKKNESKEIKFTDANRPNKIGFFMRIKRAIFNVEQYGEFILEKTRVSIKYFLLLVLIVSLLLGIVSTYHFGRIVNKAFNYIDRELPNFTYENGKMSFEKYAEGYDEDLDFCDIINTQSELSDKVKEDYKNKVKQYSSAVIFLQDEIILFEAGNFREFSYKDISNMYDFEINNKADLIEKLNSVGITGINSTYFVAVTLSLYITNLLTFIGDVLMVCIFGYLVAKMSGMPLNVEKTFVLSIYSLTLSIVLNTAYSVLYSLTGFVIEYFNWMYLLVAYVYIIAAILIIKSDLIKQQMELQKIYKVEAEVKKELQEQKEKDEEQEEEKEDESDTGKEKGKKKEKEKPVINREPDGSEI